MGKVAEPPKGWREREFVDVRTVAWVLSIGYATACRMLATGAIPGRVMVGSAVRVRTADFRAWVESR